VQLPLEISACNWLQNANNKPPLEIPTQGKCKQYYTYFALILNFFDITRRSPPRRIWRL